MSMKKLTEDIRVKREIELTDKVYVELKLESQIDMLVVRLVVHNLMIDETSMETINDLAEEDDISLADVVLSLMSSAADSLGNMIEGVELTEENAKELRGALAQNIENDYSDEDLENTGDNK